MNDNRVTLLGVPLDPVTADQAILKIQKYLDSSAQHHVMTPNSEMLVYAHHHTDFRELLRSTDFNLPDSAGLLVAARMTKQHLPERVTGVDTVTELCLQLTKEHPVFLLGAAPGVAERAADVLTVQNPDLRIVGTHSGSPHDEDADGIIRHINSCQPHLLLVAFGAPRQDLWIQKHLKRLSSVRVAMGVGGTFDFLAGRQKRAPRWMQRIGLEWLARLIREPRRIRRIFNAVVVFPILVLTSRRS